MTSEYVAGRDFNLVPNSEYKGYYLGNESYQDDEQFYKAMFAIYKPIGNNKFVRIADVPTGSYNQKTDIVMASYKKEVDKLMNTSIEEINQILKLAGRPVLSEGYNGRVEAVVNAVVDAKPTSKEQILPSIESAASKLGIVEYKLGKTAWKDFVKDVLAALKGKLGKMPNKSSAAKEANDTLLAKVAAIIVDSVGSSFPDGDPFDTIMPKVRRLGVSEYDVIKVADKAAKKHLYAKSYNDYLYKTWQQYTNDTDGEYGFENPWAPNI